MQTVYQQKGFSTRAAYLADLAVEYGEQVYIMADLLGPSEDFDGLPVSLEYDDPDMDDMF